MTEFVDDLEEACNEAAMYLRDAAERYKTETSDRDYSGQRYEAQMVAETYHQLRNMGYKPKELWLELPFFLDEDELKSDLFYQDDKKSVVVEFKVLWEGHLNEDGSIKEGSLKESFDAMEKLTDKYFISSEIDELVLVIAYVGLSKLFNLNEFQDSISRVPEFRDRCLDQTKSVRVISC